MQQAYAYACTTNQGRTQFLQNGMPHYCPMCLGLMLTTTRKWKSTRHPNHTPISSNDYASIIWTWRLGEYLPTQHLGIEANSICELIVSSVPFSGYDGFVSSVLASIYKQIEREGRLFGLNKCGAAAEKQLAEETISSSTFPCRSLSFPICVHL